MIDPEKARATLREYHATASDQQIIDDLRRHSPELARRLGVDVESAAVRQTPRMSMRGALGTFRRSVLRLFT